MENGYYQIKKVYVLFFLFFCVFLITLGYFNYLIDLKIDKIVQVSHELANHMVEFDALQKQLLTVQTENLTLLKEQGSLKVELASNILKDPSLVTVMSNGMTDDYKIFLIRLLVGSVVVLGFCGGTYYVSSVFAGSFVGKSLAVLNNWGLDALNFVTGYSVLKQFDCVDRFNNTFRIVLGNDQKTCGISFQVPGQANWTPLDLFIKDKTGLVAALADSNLALPTVDSLALTTVENLALTTVENLVSGASSNLVSEVGTHLTAALESAVIDGEAAELASRFAWMLEFT